MEVFRLRFDSRQKKKLLFVREVKLASYGSLEFASPQSRVTNVGERFSG